MEQLPFWIPALFIMITIVAAWLFFKATHFNKAVLLIVVGWSLLQAGISLSGFYQNTSGIPPRFGLLLLPPLVCILILFSTRKGRHLLDLLDVKTLTLLHTIRIFVELVLYGLFLHHAIPKIMTFEGRNLDILAGLSAPVIWYFYYQRKQLNKRILLVWNLVCLGLLLNISVTAILSSPFPFQKFGFEQPNIALGHFPYCWLPSFVVPVVLLSHLTAIRRLLLKSNAKA